jgi:hypothetical protein
MTPERLAVPPERPRLRRMAAAGEPERARSGDPRGTHSGRLLLRMPEELHAALSGASKREGVSLNAFITSTLASAVGWRDGAPRPASSGKRARGKSAAAQQPRRRGLELLLIANMAIVAGVGVLALVLLVRTLR